MANPNIVAVSSILAETFLDADVTASAATLVTCASDKVVKVNSLVIANIDGTNAASISVWITRSSTDHYLLKTVSVPADTTLIVVDTPIYLMEGDILKGGASAASDLDLFISYEVLDDA